MSCASSSARALLLATVLGVMLKPPVVRADARVERAATASTLVLAGDGCPDAALVRRLLAPLLGPETTLQIGDDTTPLGPGVVHVRDQGDDYTIELAHTARRQHDAARDCAERARVAAVFIALNLQSDVRLEPPRETQPETPAASLSSPAALSPGVGRAPARAPWGVGLGAFALATLAVPERSFAPGAGLSLWLRRGLWLLGIRAAGLGESSLTIRPAQPGGHAALLRLPGALFAGLLWRASRVELGPVLGLALDVLRARGLGLARAERLWRVNLGAEIGLEGRVFLSDRWGLSGLLEAQVFPRQYQLRVEPDAREAHTPRLWLGAQLGLLCRLR